MTKSFYKRKLSLIVFYIKKVRASHSTYLFHLKSPEQNSANVYEKNRKKTQTKIWNAIVYFTILSEKNLQLFYGFAEDVSFIDISVLNHCC